MEQVPDRLTRAASDDSATPGNPTNQDPESRDMFMNLVANFRLSRAVWLAAHFRLADAIGTGPTSAEVIAKVSGTHLDSLQRLMNTLTAAGLFHSSGDGYYTPTPSSALLRSDHPKSQRAWCDVMLGNEHYEAWESIETSLRTGQTAFDVRFGMSTFEYYTTHPEAGRSFAQSMTSTTRAFEDEILKSDPFPPFTFAVDVGGSHGSLIQRLLERSVGARGIVFDLPNVIDGWAREGYDDLGGRFTGIGGNFFESVPDGGDLYLLKLILHDWDDERAGIILRRVRESMRLDGHVAIVETVLPESPTDLWGCLKDLNMLAVTGGRERTKKMFERLLEDAGFRLERVVPTGARLGVIIATPC